MFDLIIYGGRVFDGTGQESYSADIGICGDRIQAVGDLSSAECRDVIDATGLSVLPGFIDTHVHSDMSLLFDRQHAEGLYQGVTTEILGQDGLSYAPLSPDNLHMYAKYLRGLNGLYADTPLNFSNVTEYLNKFHKKIAINVAYQVPHGTIRLESLGFHDIPLKGYAMEKAKDLMRQSFEEGAVAFSTGLSYFPCSYSDTDELVELCSVCTEYDVPFVSHLRSVFKDKWIDPVGEAIEIARRSGCRLHFSHLKTDDRNYGRVQQMLQPMENAMRDGVRITLETYPFYTGSGYVLVFLPPWAVEGGYEATLDRLANQDLRPQLIQGIKENTFSYKGVFTHLAKNESYAGRTFEDVASERGQNVEDMICSVLLEEELEVGYRGIPPTDGEICRQLDEDYVQLLSKPYYMICSDAIPMGLKPHPRTTSTFPRFLRLALKYGMSLETFANRASDLPAKTFGLEKRGRIQEGYFADLVILDAPHVKENATYEDPRRAPDGINSVVVNGKIAVLDGRVTTILNGYAIKRRRS